MKLMQNFQRDFIKPRRTFPLAAFLALLIVCLCGCAPSVSPGDGAQNPSASNDVPELTDDVIRERINYTRVRGIPDENGTGEPINWTFVENEPKEIVIVEKKIEGDHATVVLDIKTGSGPNARNPRSLNGQMRTEWALKTGWALRRWEIVDTENISMKVKNLPKPPAQNSNR